MRNMLSLILVLFRPSVLRHESMTACLLHVVLLFKVQKVS
jgi:hypothetical protein